MTPRAPNHVVMISRSTHYRYVHCSSLLTVLPVPFDDASTGKSIPVTIIPHTPKHRAHRVLRHQ